MLPARSLREYAARDDCDVLAGRGADSICVLRTRWRRVADALRGAARNTQLVCWRINLAKSPIRAGSAHRSLTHELCEAVAPVSGDRKAAAYSPRSNKLSSARCGDAAR